MTKPTPDPTADAPIPVHIVMVLDRSGSMGPLADDLIGGVNEFLADQRTKPGKCRLTMVQFDDGDPFEVLHDAVKIGDVGDLTSDVYLPRGATPLLDAEGRSITRAMERETARKANGKRAEAVLFVTYTDGHENASREYTRASLAALKAEREAAGWTFIYLGAGHDAYAQSSSMGTRSANTSSVRSTPKGMRSTFTNASRLASGYRDAAVSGDSVALTSASVDAYAALGVDKPADDTDDDGPVVLTTTGGPDPRGRARSPQRPGRTRGR